MALALFRPVLSQGALAIAALSDYAFVLGHVAAFCVVTTGAVFGALALVRDPDVRVFGGYFIVGIAVSLSSLLAFIIFVAFPRMYSPIASNQTMKPTAPLRNIFSDVVTTPCGGLSYSR